MEPVAISTNISHACIACKKRKGKCIGNPCQYCEKKGVACMFTTGKKRGPLTKKVKVQLAVEGQISTALSAIQQSMNTLCRQTNFVEFYFESVGFAIPHELKPALLIAPLTNEHSTQLYIIFAHVLSTFGVHEVANQCINEAFRITNLLNCDTLDAATALLMMSLYLGDNNPKSTFYSSMAHSISKLPYVNTSPIAAKINYVTFIFQNHFDYTSTSMQRKQMLYNALPKSPEGLTTIEWLMVLMARVSTRCSMLLEFETGDPTVFANIPFISEETRESILVEANELDQALQVQEGQTPSRSLAFVRFRLEYIRFILEWMTRSKEDAFAKALLLLDIFLQNADFIVLRQGPKASMVLDVAYFFEICGAIDKKCEILRRMEITFEKLGRKNEFEEACHKMLLHPPVNNIAMLEQELLMGDISPMPNGLPDISLSSELQQFCQGSNIVL